MGKYTFKSDDFKLIKELTKITKSIENIYQKMFDLEISNKKDTEEYKKILDYLTIVLEVEEELYQKANLDAKRSNQLVDYILEDMLPQGFLNNDESIMKQDYESLFLRRILNILVTNITHEEATYRDILPDELIELMLHLGISCPEQLVSNSIHSSIELQDAHEKDKINGYLMFLQEFIENDSYKNFRNELIRSKYNTIFINRKFEKDMIVSGFDIPNTMRLSSKDVAASYQMNIDLYNAAKNSYGIKVATKQIYEIMKISDMDYNDLNKAISSILRQCLMKSSFLLLDSEAISDINYDFHEFIENEDFTNTYPYHNISEQLVIKCFKDIKKDRAKINTSSLKK